MEALNSPVTDIEWIPVEESNAPGRVRGAAMALARRLGFTEHRIGEIAIAATELGTNVQRHAKEGLILVRLRRLLDETAVELIVIDRGPGVLDMQKFTPDGSSSTGSLGIGLGAIERLATHFDFHSVIDRGTVMVATFWPNKAPTAVACFDGLTRPMGGETICGDAWAQRCDGNIPSYLLVDGLGHGEFAAIAARAAITRFQECEYLSPAAMLLELNTTLRSTRGAAAAVARVDAGKNALVFAGIGNIAVWVDDGNQRRGLHCSPGIVGNNAKRTREVTLDLPLHALLLMHSDGLSAKWDLQRYPGLRRRAPSLIAATLLRDAAIRHDDASILVAQIQ